MVRYALTGTPGTGKTTISKLLDQKIIALSDYYKDSSEGKTGSGEWIIDIDKIKKNVFITEDSICRRSSHEIWISRLCLNHRWFVKVVLA